MFKNSVVFKSKNFKKLNWDYETIILFTLFLCGVILGVFLLKNSTNEFRDFINSCLRNYISTKNQSNFFMCFSGVAVFLLVFVIIDFIFGLCAMGTPLVWIVPVCFGAISGCCFSGMFINYGLKGLLYCFLVDLPCYAITAATLVKCCCESTKMSVGLFSCIGGNSNFTSFCSFKDYLLNYLILCIPILLGALLSTVCFKIFSSLFIFAWFFDIFS